MGISAKDFEAMERRVSTGRKSTPADSTPPASARLASTQTLIGVDPSLRKTGWGVILRKGRDLHWTGHGSIPCPASWSKSRCLAHIHKSISDVLQEFSPNVAIVEGLFYAQNFRTALIMGEARGASLAALAAAGIDIHELAPRKVKLAIVGYGAAQKDAVAKMVQRLLRLPDQPDPDSADALALAMAYAQEVGGIRASRLKSI